MPFTANTFTKLVCPPVSETVPIVVVPFIKVTVPAAVPPYCPVTVAVNVTDCPAADGLGDETIEQDRESLGGVSNISR